MKIYDILPLHLNATDLTIYNIDIDEVLTRFKRTQNINLVYLGAVMVAGPAGAMVTKAPDYAILLNFDPSKQNTIREFVSSWKIKNGKIIGDDVAFTTNKSRPALNGGIDFNKEVLVGLTLAVVDEKGCALISQTISGKLDKPRLEEVNAITTILAPVPNVLKLITRGDCKPFYTSSLAHPK